MATPYEIIQSKQKVFGSELLGPTWADRGTDAIVADDINTVGVDTLDGKSCALIRGANNESLSWNATDFTDPNYWSFALWVEANSIPNGTFFYIGSESMGTVGGLRFQFSDTGSAYNIFWVLSDATGSTFALGTVTTTKYNDERMHLAARYDKVSEELKLYCDGTLKETANISGVDPINNSCYFRLVEEVASGQYKASQLIVTNGAASQLSEADITDLYNSGDVPDWTQEYEGSLSQFQKLNYRITG